MAVGVSTYLQNKFLECLRGTTFSVATVYIQMHTGDPGSAGTANVSGSCTGRKSITYGTASGGIMSTTAGTTDWTSGAGSGVTLTHYSRWDASSGGNFLGSAALDAPVLHSPGQAYHLGSDTWNITPKAA